MLILIAGITGRSGLDRGHQVRGLGRSPDKLDHGVRSQLESFVVSSTYYDIAALEQAATGVDAVTCAYGGLPELMLDGQLLLLRAAERAGVKVGIFLGRQTCPTSCFPMKFSPQATYLRFLPYRTLISSVQRFLAASWNYDWRRIPLRAEEIYDPSKAFHAQYTISSNIKPLQILTGILAEAFFGTPSQGGFTPRTTAFGIRHPCRTTVIPIPIPVAPSQVPGK